VLACPLSNDLQDKVISIAKFLRGKLAKAPAHKQPLHTQVLTRPSYVRTLWWHLLLSVALV